MTLGAAVGRSNAQCIPSSRYGAVLSFVVLLALLVLVTSSAGVGAQVTPIDDEPGIEAPGLGNIVGSPEAGPEPEDAGDRGGWAQLTLAVVVFGGVLFIGSRILKESRAGRSARIPDTSG